jgi:hypothetical protein
LNGREIHLFQPVLEFDWVKFIDRQIYCWRQLLSCGRPEGPSLRYPAAIHKSTGWLRMLDAGSVRGGGSAIENRIDPSARTPFPAWLSFDHELELEKCLPP